MNIKIGDRVAITPTGPANWEVIEISDMDGGYVRVQSVDEDDLRPLRWVAGSSIRPADGPHPVNVGDIVEVPVTRGSGRRFRFRVDAIDSSYLTGAWVSIGTGEVILRRFGAKMKSVHRAMPGVRVVKPGHVTLAEAYAAHAQRILDTRCSGEAPR